MLRRNYQMKTPEQWVKARDFMGGEYDTNERAMALIAQVQEDARAALVKLVLEMVETFEALGGDAMARIEARKWAVQYRQEAEKLGATPQLAKQKGPAEQRPTGP